MLPTDIDDGPGIENEVVLLDESVEIFRFASILGSDFQGGHDAVISNIGDDNILHAIE